MFAAVFLFALAADAPSSSVLLRAEPGAPFVAFAQVGETIYVVDVRGVVRASHDGGRTFRAGRFPARRSSTVSMFEPVVDDDANAQLDELEANEPIVDPLVDDGAPALELSQHFFLERAAPHDAALGGNAFGAMNRIVVHEARFEHASSIES